MPRNYRNGYTKKTVKTQLGEVNWKIPRDRNGEYEPRIIGKYSRNADGMEDKILSLYACGMSQRDIAEQIKELYGVEISPELMTKIGEKIMPEVTAWQNRPPEKVYPFVFMDAIHYKVREDHHSVTKAAYVVLGIPLEGQKDILGIWIGEHESSKFWLNVLNDLKSRGIMDVYLFCTDGLCGMMQAIEAVYPQSRLQRCIVHQIRSSTKYVSYKDSKHLMSDLKQIYTAATLSEAEANLQCFAENWRTKYPSYVKSWEENWCVLSTFFEYPPEIRKIIYTTNIIEGLNRQFRQITKNKPGFTNDDSLRRMLYLASKRIMKRERYSRRSGAHTIPAFRAVGDQGIKPVLCHVYTLPIPILSNFAYTKFYSMPYIMDNLRTHHCNFVGELIRAKGAIPLYLPPYSPDLNPIEKMWVKMKSILRKWRIRIKDKLIPAILQALNLLTSSDCQGWFTCAGY